MSLLMFRQVLTLTICFFITRSNDVWSQIGICLWIHGLSLCQVSESVTLQPRKGCDRGPLLWQPRELCFGPCSSRGASCFSVEHAAALQHLFPFTLEPFAPACKLTFLFQPSPVCVQGGKGLQSVTDSGPACFYKLLKVSHKAWSILNCGGRKRICSQSFRFKVNANFCVGSQIHL